MKIIALSNTKGGVGKTTMATTIGSGLAMLGYKVLIIDADPQGHAGVSFGMPKSSGFHDAIIKDAQFQDVIQVIDPSQYATPNVQSQGALYIITGNFETRTVDQQLASSQELMKIHDRLRELNGLLDVILIDTSPTPSMLHSFIYLACDGILYPTQTKFLSLEGLGQSMKTRHSAQRLLERLAGSITLDLVGIIPTMYRSQTVAHQENLKVLVNKFGDYCWNPISLRIAWEDASEANQSIFALNEDKVAISQAWETVYNVDTYLGGQNVKQTQSS